MGWNLQIIVLWRIELKSIRWQANLHEPITMIGPTYPDDNDVKLDADTFATVIK